ncbi:hypothetical protein SEA_ZOOMAN_242 [Microbacterium phage Zooman]|nr:hypothetical protein SEA_ZOOMAN_242 [Microbacterium phage Zooman]
MTSSRPSDVMGYMVSVDEMIFQDEDALRGLEERMVDHLREMVIQSDYTRAEWEDYFFHIEGKPLYAHDEDGTKIGRHVLYMVEIPVRK